MAEQHKLLPYSAKDLETISLPRFSISVSCVFLVGFAAPPTLMISTLLMTIIDDYEGSTYTHCHVLHLVPSLSAVIHSTQQFWVLGTLLELPIRLLAGYFYWRYRERRLPLRDIRVTTLFLLCFIQNNVSFIVVAQHGEITGTNLIHVVPVLSALISGCISFGISFYGLWRCERNLTKSYEILSYQLKRQLAIYCFPAVVIMWPFYFLHTLFCVPLAYTCFTVCEYIVTLCNMGYIWTSYLDFYNIYISFKMKKGFCVFEI